MATLLTAENKEYVPSSWESVPCPFCAYDRHKPHERFGPQNRYAYVKCRRCGLVYAHRRPKYEASFVETAYEVYDVESHHVSTGGALSQANQSIVAHNKITLRQMERHLGRKGKLLDIGCASGLFLYAAKEEGWCPTGIDVSEKMTRHCRDAFGVPTYLGQYHTLDLSEGGPFDVIYCSHVIEHILNPNEWMEKFRADLKADGLLCLNVPNQYSADRVLKRCLKRAGLKRENWARWRTPDHLYEPHARPMLYLMQKHAFQTLEFFTYSHNENETPTQIDRLMHLRLKWGSKLRFFAAPNAHS